MEISKLQAIGDDVAPIKNLAKDSGVSFDNVMANEIKSTNSKIIAAEKNAQLYAVGETDNLHQVMISISKAKTSLEVMSQVRSRVVEGVQDLMKMSI